MTLINIFTIATTALSIVTYAILIFLVLRKNPKSWLNRSLALHLFCVNIFQIVGGIIMLVPDPKLSLFLYRFATLAAVAPLTFYAFVQKLLKKEIPKRLIWGAILFCILWAVLSVLNPGILIKDVVWSETAQFYLLVLNFPLGAILSILFLLPLFAAFLDLVNGYRSSKSTIERNRLKYLFLSILLIPLGFMAILIPPIRHYPTDMVTMTLSGVLLAYTILRYQLLDITIVIKKGLLYSILTTVVTGIYLLFSLLLQFLFQRPGVPLSFPAIISTAFVVALIFQPLQTGTQHLINRIFFRRKYDFQKLVADLSLTLSETLDLNLLSTNFVNLLCQTIQIDRAVLFLVNEETNSLEVQKIRNLPQETRSITISLNSPLARLLSQSDEVKSRYALKEKKVSLEGLEGLDLEIFVPLRSRERLRGILALGPKLSGELYALEEFNLLEIIAHNASLALDNASLFAQLAKEKEKVEEARAILEIKVQARTKELRELAESLETKVKERTKELQEKVEELERFYKLAVGRELKMVELKKEIERLKKAMPKSKT